MHCHQAEHLLSLNLDGRLSSGQRQLLSRHLAGCGSCRDLDRELMSARELVLSLPMQRVSSGFREELWQRIRAGEGSPEATFREPVPLAAKVRYFATGAAAAAVLLLAANLLRGRPSDQDGPAPRDNTAQGQRRLAPRDVAPADLAAVVPATPDRLANLVTSGYAEAVRTLHAKVQDLEQSQVSPELLENLRNDVDRAHSFAGMLRWLVEHKYMYLPADEVKSLTAIEVVGEQARAFQDADSLRRVLRPIRSLPLEQPSSYFCDPCVKDEPSFNQEFLRQLQNSRLDRTFGATIELVRVPAPGGAEQIRIFIRR